MLLYADEDFSFPVVEELRQQGHDVLRAQEDGRTATPDPDILARAHALGRAVLTYNRIHIALTGLTLGRWCIRVNRPPPIP